MKIPKMHKTSNRIRKGEAVTSDVPRGRRRWSLEESREWRKKRRRRTAEGVEAGRKKEEEVVIGVYYHYHS